MKVKAIIIVLLRKEIEFPTQFYGNNHNKYKQSDYGWRALVMFVDDVI